MSDLSTARHTEAQETSTPSKIVITYDGKPDQKIIEYLAERSIASGPLVFLGPDDLPQQPNASTTLYLNHSPRFLGDDQKRKAWENIDCFRFVSNRSGDIVSTTFQKVKDFKD